MVYPENTPLDRVVNRNQDAYSSFKKEFDEKIASMAEPPEGKSRIQLLQEMLVSLNNETKCSSMKYVDELIDDLNDPASSRTEES